MRRQRRYSGAMNCSRLCFQADAHVAPAQAKRRASTTSSSTATGTSWTCPVTGDWFVSCWSASAASPSARCGIEHAGRDKVHATANSIKACRDAADSQCACWLAAGMPSAPRHPASSGRPSRRGASCRWQLPQNLPDRQCSQHERMPRIRCSEELSHHHQCLFRSQKYAQQRASCARATAAAPPSARRLDASQCCL